MRRQRGVAAVTAILIVAVAASAASLMLAQQSAMLDQTLLVASRAQADQYAQAGLDWARGVLAQDARANTVDTLEEGWARPIAGMPIERAVVAGAIADEQGKFNLNNLIDANRRSEPDVRLLRQLLAALDLAPDLAEAVVEWLDPNGSDAYYLSLPRPYRAPRGPILQVDELYRVRGFDAATVARLRPYVTALPKRTRINANTAPERLVAAALGIAPDKAAALLAERRARPFADEAAVRARAQAAGIAVGNEFAVASEFFSVRVQVAQDDVQLETEALVQRAAAAQGATAIIWRRPRY